ncbi:MAG TPA: DUF1194 domain-containing protein [Alphaproteobacteria bacterium]|nr:DUF1194 domain-containing protein [Alphaproteobacteria bacterium]
MRAIATKPSTNSWRLAFAGAIAALILGAQLRSSVADSESIEGRPEKVDTALVLAVDVSGSVDAQRYALQMEGIAEAFEDPAVQRTILSGPNRSMTVALVEWSNTASLAIPWTLIASPADAQVFAAKVRHAPRTDNAFTCMSRALQLVDGKVLPFAPVPAERTIIDVSGDGHDNCNLDPPIDAMRDRLVAEGVTINGLPILAGQDAATLEDWYRSHVIGGNSAFIVTANGFTDFGRAIRQKFMVEISMR